jgi:hypothetical protein
MKSIQKVETKGYLGNPLVKKDGINQNWTQEEIDEYSKCMNDPAYFARTYLKVIHLDRGLVPFDLYDYQENMFDHFNNNRFSIVLACRQSGKCQTFNSYIYIRNKKTNIEERISIGDFHERIKRNM